MMAPDGNLDYALARIQAQYGRRLDERAWRRVEASHDLAQYLDAMRASSLAEWVSSIERTRDSHAMERSLRTAWRRYVENVAAWHPQEWQPWLAWLGWLPTLSLLAQLARPEPAPAWMMADPVCGPIAPGTLAERIAALKGTVLAVFEPAFSARAPIGALWRARWRTLKPRSDAHTSRLLDALLRDVDAYAQRLAATETDSSVLRQQLIVRLRKLFRATQGTVVATVCYLGLLAFDLERLRGGLANRAILEALAKAA
jgi:hypothetical protein